MSTWAVAMVRDEADVIAGMLTHLADEVDGIIVADNRSTDDTRDILEALELPVPLVIVDDAEVGYLQSVKMTGLARRAACEHGAEWILPVDADELWFSHHERVSVVLAGVGGNVACAPLYNHFATALDPDDGNPFETMLWRQREPGALRKVAFRWHPDAVIHQGNHGVDHPDPSPADAGLEVRHFPYRSPEQMTRKALNGAEAYAATDLPENVGAHWRSYAALIDRYGPAALHAVWREHFWFSSPVDSGMVLDPAPFCRWTR